MYVIVISAANSMKLHAIFSLVIYFCNDLWLNSHLSRIYDLKSSIEKQIPW